MTGKGVASAEMENLFGLRRRILTVLYDTFREAPYAPVEPAGLEARCGADTRTMNWNLVYLEKCGYVELGKSADALPYVAYSVGITAGGIDLVEDPEAFEKRFPTPRAD